MFDLKELDEAAAGLFQGILMLMGTMLGIIIGLIAYIIAH